MGIIAQNNIIKNSLLMLIPVAILLLQGCYMIQSSGEYFGVSVTGKKVVFLLDISGSMEGKDEGPLQTQILNQANNQLASMAQRAVGGTIGNMIARQINRESTKLGSAKRELLPAIRGLSPDSRFTIITFGGNVASWRPNLVEASTMNKNMAAYHVQTLSARGGTRAFTALKQAFHFPGIDTIYFLSDGLPTDAGPPAILREIARINSYGRVAIHTIGLGEDQNRDFLCRLASANRGTYVKDSIVQCGFSR